MVDIAKVKRQRAVSPKKRRELNTVTVNLVKSGKQIGLFHHISPEMLANMDAEEIIAAIGAEEGIEEVEVEGVKIAVKVAQYGLSTKIMSLMYMQSTLRDFEHGDGTITEVPEYSKLHPILGISRVTLKRWWDEREDIWKQNNLIKNEGLNIATTNLSMVVIKLSTALLSVDFLEMVKSDDPKVFYNMIKLMDVLFSKIRLVQNLSTENIAHRHSLTDGGVGYVLPAEKSVPPRGRPKKDKNDLGEPKND